MIKTTIIGILSTILVNNIIAQEYNMANKIEPLQPSGNNFINQNGEIVKLWGVNLVALYPKHEDAIKIAEKMSDFNMNVARPHHMLRPSRDWIWGSQISALSKYKDNSFDQDEEAWDRFDFLNAELKKHGIYLMFALRWSRKYMPGDVTILETDEVDKNAWIDAMTEQNKRHWKESIDSTKILPFIDERAALIDEKFATDLLTHKNPYTGKTYAEDSQVITMEVINEYTSEYVLICRNTLPKYFQDKLTKKWSDFAKANGVTSTNIYKVNTPKEIEVRGKFFRKLDNDRFLRMKALSRKLGYKGAFTFSNLWHGDANTEANEQRSDYIEDHLYSSPMRTIEEKADFVSPKTRSRIKDKPFIIGELNIAEWGDTAKRDAKYRSLMMLATATYGSFQDWSGIVWYAWQHGDKNLGNNGLAKNIGRSHSLGEMYNDEMYQDHLRTSSIIFRKGLIKPSVEPIVININRKKYASNYEDLMKVSNPLQAGWQSIHGFYTSYKNPDKELQQTNAFWKIQEPADDILISDTGEITKNIAQHQLTVSAPMTECFGGFLTDKAPLGLKHLKFENTNGFATVMMVSNDDKIITKSENLVLSRTCLDDDGNEIHGIKISINGLKIPADGKKWYIKLTRPVNVAQALKSFSQKDSFEINYKNGSIILPEKIWFECELQYK